MSEYSGPVYRNKKEKLSNTNTKKRFQKIQTGSDQIEGQPKFHFNHPTKRFRQDYALPQKTQQLNSRTALSQPVDRDMLHRKIEQAKLMADSSIKHSADIPFLMKSDQGTQKKMTITEPSKLHEVAYEPVYEPSINVKHEKDVTNTENILQSDEDTLIQSHSTQKSALEDLDAVLPVGEVQFEKQIPVPSTNTLIDNQPVLIEKRSIEMHEVREIAKRLIKTKTSYLLFEEGEEN